MRGYELMYILDPTLDEEATQALIGQIEDFVTKQGVQIEKTDPWGKRRLAYRIGRHWDGFYVLSELKAEAQTIAEIERRLRVTDGVLRFLTVRIDTEQAKLDRQRARKAVAEKARRARRGEPARAAVADDEFTAFGEGAEEEVGEPDEQSSFDEADRPEGKKGGAGPARETD